MKLKSTKLVFIFTLAIFIILLPTFVLASETNGTINPTYEYAWSENAGWINFSTSGGNVAINDTGITGYAWSNNYGWINLNPSGSGVSNNNKGILSGSAWGENTGWIDFSGVTIDSSGYFSGYASGTVTGQISFNCSNTNSCSVSDFKIRTDWRPQSARVACNNSLDDDGDGLIDYPNDPGCLSASDNDETSPASGGWTPPPPTEPNNGFKFFITPDITNDTAVMLHFEGGPDAEKIAIADNPNFSFAIYINYATSTPWVLSKGYGKKTLYVKFSNKFARYSKIISDSIIYTPKKISQTTPQKYFAATILFNRNLRLGDKGEDVKALQKFLNQNGFKLADSKLGSLGNETEYFYSLTKKALIKFQDTYASRILTSIGLSKGTGFFGPSTRMFVNSFFLKQPTTKIPTKTPSIQQPKTLAQPTLVVFTKTLRVGMQNYDVKRLQQLLNSDTDTKLADQNSGSTGNETKYFGQLTQDAVKRFQKKYSVVSFGNEVSTGYGLVGPKTRTKLKIVFGLK